MLTSSSRSLKIESIGEEIGLELGKQFVQNYNNANPENQSSYIIGKDILMQILSQPGCAGIQLLKAHDENGEETLVYLGINQSGKQLISYQVVDVQGHINKSNAIIADRITRPRVNGIDEDFGWEIE